MDEEGEVDALVEREGLGLPESDAVPDVDGLAEREAVGDGGGLGDGEREPVAALDGTIGPDIALDKVQLEMPENAHNRIVSWDKQRYKWSYI